LNYIITCGEVKSRQLTGNRLGVAINGMLCRGRWEEMPEDAAYDVRGYGECKYWPRKTKLALLDFQQGNITTERAYLRIGGTPWYSLQVYPLFDIPVSTLLVLAVSPFVRSPSLYPGTSNRCPRGRSKNRPAGRFTN
jgi:hypothetical protein